LNELIPPSLFKLGLPQKGDPDIETIWLTPYPVIKRYRVLCDRLGYKYLRPGEPGHITSGYRAHIIGDNEISPHHFAFAIDIIVDDMLKAADKAADLFSRIGFYPGRGFLHLDQAPDNWVNKYMKSRYWVQIAGVYRIFDDYLSARNCAESEA